MVVWVGDEFWLGAEPIWTVGWDHYRICLCYLKFSNHSVTISLLCARNWAMNSARIKILVLSPGKQTNWLTLTAPFTPAPKQFRTASWCCQLKWTNPQKADEKEPPNLLMSSNPDTDIETVPCNGITFRYSIRHIPSPFDDFNNYIPAPEVLQLRAYKHTFYKSASTMSSQPKGYVSYFPRDDPEPKTTTDKSPHTTSDTANAKNHSQPGTDDIEKHYKEHGSGSCPEKDPEWVAPAKLDGMFGRKSISVPQDGLVVGDRELRKESMCHCRREMLDCVDSEKEEAKGEDGV